MALSKKYPKQTSREIVRNPRPRMKRKKLTIQFREPTPEESSLEEDNVSDGNFKLGKSCKDFGLPDNWVRRSIRGTRAVSRYLTQVDDRIKKPLARVSIRRQKGTKLKKPSMRITIRYIRSWNIPQGKLRSMGIAAPKKPSNYWSFENYKFKLGHNVWEYLSMPDPTEQQVREVHRRLVEYHTAFSIESFIARPAHAPSRKPSIDDIFQVIFSQSTGNAGAIDTHSRLCNTYPFIVQGKKYAGTMPNWHTVRRISQGELEKAITPAGYQTSRAAAIKQILDVVYTENLKTSSHVSCCDDNLPEAKDFVPGLLAIDYLENPKDISDDELLGKLLQFPKIGLKSAMCILGFVYKRPCFVVDTHVLRMAKWLGWVPKHANENQAAMYLHSIVPDDIKFDLHNQIWTHCANENTRINNSGTLICPFCGSNPPAKRDFSAFVCPLKDLLPPLSQRWNRKFKFEGKTQEQFEGDKETEQHDGDKQWQQDEDQLESSSSISKSDQDNVVTGRSRRQSTPKRRKTWPRTVDYNKMTPEEAAREGYLLWEFRPMDNSFMQDWGTFQPLPRFKWERPDIMDPDVAVTPEYADAVLTGKIGHKWMKGVK